jgi:hypothetical protein
MLKAVVKDNKCHCPKCGINDYHLTGDYKAVRIKGIPCTEFIARCKCGEHFYFQSWIGMENHKHIAVDRSAVDIIKEEKEETYNNGCS